ncbi:hypothetical protein [Paractinoplanes hotanensis]|uniref:GIY-YIG nuclease family protein n=1 Tax=Paractinoplanes hotanensis TaxID=2906497 RepID=A0ABT0YGD7_9ACTN|nr:hypothetical protein [Actinoplanes hotanensis]MCM4085126.1 hypothetical protein [Actinoplanes hotanensis]
MTANTTVAGPGTVYALRDPRTKRIRYIGATGTTLAVRLARHLAKPSSDALAAWLADLKAAGLKPIIEPVRSDIPAEDMLTAENAEIHSHVLAGDELLNINGVSAAKKILADWAAALAQRNSEREWSALADAVRAGCNGPLPPGHHLVIAVREEIWQAIQKAREAKKVEDSTPADFMPPAGVDPNTWRAPCVIATQNYYACSKLARDLLLEDAGWAIGLEFHGSRKDNLERCITGVVGASELTSAVHVGRYLALLRWYLTAIAPWRHLAARAGRPVSGPAFHAWLTGDPQVRDAAAIVEKVKHTGHAADQLQDQYDPGPADLLVSLAAAWTLPRPLTGTVTEIVKVTLRDLTKFGTLDESLARVYLEADPEALDHVYGPDLASRLDADLVLPAGSGTRIIQHLARLLPASAHLADAATRTTAAFPTTPLPNLAREIRTTPTRRAAVAAFAAAGHTSAPQQEATAYIVAVQAIWTPSVEFCTGQEAL